MDKRLPIPQYNLSSVHWAGLLSYIGTKCYITSMLLCFILRINEARYVEHVNTNLTRRKMGKKKNQGEKSLS